ncbi:MAG: 5'-nucleotidase C-terminal domain-containing protein, partial [Bacteroidales bacterium]|nr:5'-nucleotidase C-terminal domain-containing protein [Bacteroidales bacterium]
VFLFAAVLLTAMCVTACEKEKPEENTKPDDKQFVLPLIETTDLHGYIINQVDKTVHYRLAYIADKVNDVRGRGAEYNKERLLLLDGGDLYQGASISNMLDGKPVYVAYDHMGYDAVAVGNHEFDWDFDLLAEQDATMPDYEWGGKSFVNEVPVVCANLYRDGARVSCTKDYVILEKTAVNSSGKEVKVKIGVIGFAVNYASSIMTSKFSGKGYAINEDYSIANDIASELEDNGQCDATILLIHGAADVAAESLGANSAIDLVLGGHSHDTMSGTAASGLPYLQGGRYGEHYATTKLVFTEGDGKVSFTGVDKLETPLVNATRDLHSSEGQNADDLDEDILAVSDQAIADIASQAKEVIGYITVDASTYAIAGSLGRACPMANWMCDIIRRIGNAEVAFVNGGGVRTAIFLEDGQTRRDITVSNVYEMFPFGNLTYVYQITYEDLLRVLEYSMTSAGSSIFTGMVGIDCYFRNYAVYSLRKDGTEIYRKNKWTGDWASRTVTLAVSEYLATTLRKDSYTGLDNPLPDWNSTSRLLYYDKIDNQYAVRVLKEEAAASGGHLYIDLSPHFIQDD